MAETNLEAPPDSSGLPASARFPWKDPQHLIAAVYALFSPRLSRPKPGVPLYFVDQATSSAIKPLVSGRIGWLCRLRVRLTRFSHARPTVGGSHRTQCQVPAMLCQCCHPSHFGQIMIGMVSRSQSN